MGSRKTSENTQMANEDEEQQHMSLLRGGLNKSASSVGRNRRKRSSMDGSGKKDVSVAINLGKAIWPAMSALGGGTSDMANVFEAIDNLHLLARTNEARLIRELANDREIGDLKERMMNEDDNGNTPPMVAALHNNKEALLALLGPFFVIPHDDDIDRLLHHRNKKGQTLLSIVVHMDSMFAAHGLLVEFEAAAHKWNPYEVTECFRTTLGSSKGAIASLNLYEKIERRRKPAARWGLCLSTFSRVLLLRMFFYLLDVISDITLLFEYYDKWSRQSTHGSSIVYPGSIEEPLPQRRCLKVEEVADGNFNGTHYVYNDFNVSLACYSHAISGKERFYGTLIMILLPFLFYFFELLRFRTFSIWLEGKVETTKMSPWAFYGLFKPFKLMVNLLLLLTWPLVAFFRQALFQYRYEASENINKTGRHRLSSILSRTIGARSQIIEVCTESSLQPLLQLYLVLINLFVWRTEHDRPRITSLYTLQDQIEKAIQYLADEEIRRMLSAGISIMAVAASYTSQYRQNKDQSLGALSTLIYFAYICLAVITRILCFEMFAMYLGPGHFHQAIIAVAFHILVMALVHFAFSDSLKQCQRRSDQLFGGWCRQLLLVIHNCLINGLANIYIHNNLEIFVTYKLDKGAAAAAMERQSRKRSVGYEEATYVPSDIRQPTAIRQFVVDSIMFIENLAMIGLAKNTVTSTSSYKEAFWVIVAVIGACYLAAMFLKFIFYWSCHPWSTLIKPRRCSDVSPDNTTPLFETSLVLFSKHVNVVAGGKQVIACSTDPHKDKIRYSETLPR